MQAEAANAPSLVISQLKITSSNGQFITLYNTTNTTLDMSKYQLEYFNGYDLTKASSSRLITLSGTVPPHSYYMVNDGALLLCYRLSINSISLGLSSTAGFIEVVELNQATPGGSVEAVLQDYVGWSKTAVAGAQTLPSNTVEYLLRQPLGADYNPSIITPGSGSWQTVQPDVVNPCAIVGVTNGTVSDDPVITGLNLLLPATEPPAVMLMADNNGVVTPNQSRLPSVDIGLMGPVITELLPNPVGSGNDTRDEFIELYNPNPVPFDLSGFRLQAGTTSTHYYTFPNGTEMPARHFVAFYASSTGLSLSNYGGQVKLIDPFGNSISATAAYTAAKDGLAWALANSKWYWTTQPTPGATNHIQSPPVANHQKTSMIAKKATKTSTKTKVKRAKTAKDSSLASANMMPSQTNNHLINNRILALVGSIALLYGTYEYRSDLANRFTKCRTYLSSRIGHRS